MNTNPAMMEKDYMVGYYQRLYRNGTTKWEIEAGEQAIREYQFTSTVDFGCGLGFWLEGARRAGATIKGFELNLEAAIPYIKNIPLIDGEALIPYLEARDASQPMEDVVQYDCVMSMGAAEQIIPERSSIFMDNLVNFTQQTLFLMAADLPLAGSSKANINNRPNEFWIQGITAKGLSYSQEETDKVRDVWVAAGAKEVITRNLMVFIRP